LLYANSKLSEIEINETIPLTIATKIKYIVINLTKNIYNENYKTLVDKRN
jgi:hypothetical protein